MAPNQYTDRRGRTWSLVLDLPTAVRIDKSDYSEITDTKFSILKPGPELYKLVMADAQLLFAVIWVMVQDQVAAKYRAYQSLDEPNKQSRLDGWQLNTPITPGDASYDYFPTDPKATPEDAQLEFVTGVHGPTINAARNAFAEALSDFFPEHRTALSMLLRQTNKATAKIDNKMLQTEPELEQMMDEELEAGTRKLLQELRSSREKKHGETSAALLPS